MSKALYPRCDCGNPEGHTGAIYHPKPGEVYEGPVQQTGATATTQYGDISFEVVVTRCGCGDPDSHSKVNQPCPFPRAVEDKGVVAFYSRSRIKRSIWRLKKLLGRI